MGALFVPDMEDYRLFAIWSTRLRKASHIKETGLS